MPSEKITTPHTPPIAVVPTPAPEPTAIERLIASIGSVPSLAIHTLIFICFFSLSIFHILDWSFMLLVLTTILSLEAIYLAIFIQITVNRHTESLKGVEEDIEEIQEDVEELGEDLEDIQEDIEEISEDVDEIQEDIEEMSEEEEGDAPPREPKVKVPKVKTERRTQTETEVLEKLSRDVERVLRELEALKGKS